MPIEDGYHALPPGKVAAVVTYVEMTARPDWIDSPVPGELTPLPPADLDAYRALFRRVGQDWLWFSRLRATDAELRQRLEQPGCQVLLYGGRGFVELLRSGDEVEIALFGLAPGETGRGAGRSMMALALRNAWQNDCLRVWLHTCTLDDPRALGFYCKMGFHAYARGIEVATDPRLQGYLPETAAPGLPLIR